MSLFNNTQFLDLPDQLGYVQCGFCTTFLLEKQAGSVGEEGEGRACEGEEEAEAPSKKRNRHHNISFKLA
ncbi:hypothetical protein HPP92_001306 [Vanilla planifolia]|uniref:Uncharacterized protein n=1 Tax=Vanilla planifolia TaxID=51239 RepID=A0A835VGX9_VANPL|nr:hypothetical protein HPP92_001306 [Vanilla planifolia]